MNDIVSFLTDRHILNDTGKFYHRQLINLPKNHQSWKYLFDRGVTEQQVVKNLIGFSLGVGLHDYLIDIGYHEKNILRRGLCFDTKRDYLSKGRVTIPCLSDGNVTNIVGRNVFESIHESPKYRVLSSNNYNIMSPDSAGASTELFIVEGPFDKLALERLGVDTISVMGTRGISESDDISWAHSKGDIYYMPDGDDPSSQAYKANMKSAIVLAKKCKYMNMIKILTLPKNIKDANDLLITLGAPKARTCLESMVASATPITQTQAWEDYLRVEKEKERKSQESRDKEIKISSIEKYPIIPILESLDINLSHITDTSMWSCACFNPEHEDTKPSVRIYEETNTFYCWSGCGYGDAIDAVRWIKGISFKEAVDFIQLLTEEENGK